MTDDADRLRAQVTAALTETEPMTAAWALVWETTELDDDGDVGGSWGSITSGASPTTTVGLLHAALTAHTRSLTGGDE